MRASRCRTRTSGGSRNTSGSRCGPRARHTYLYRAKEGAERILRHHRDHVYASVCHFFDRRERRCTVYAARPAVCRKYPYGNRCGYYSFLAFEREFHDDEDFVPSA